MPKEQAEAYFFTGKYKGEEVMLIPVAGYYTITGFNADGIINHLHLSCDLEEEIPDPKHTDVRPKVTDIERKKVTLTISY